MSSKTPLDNSSDDNSTQPPDPSTPKIPYEPIQDTTTMDNSDTTEISPQIITSPYQTDITKHAGG